MKFVKSFNLPTLVLGGGGYTIRNVARCWTYETSVLLDKEISNDLPDNEYYQYFGPDYQLHPPVTATIDNLNTRQYLESIKMQALENLRALNFAPSVQMNYVPPDYLLPDDDEWQTVRFSIASRGLIICNNQMLLLFLFRTLMKEKVNAIET